MLLQCQQPPRYYMDDGALIEDGVWRCRCCTPPHTYRADDVGVERIQLDAIDWVQSQLGLVDDGVPTRVVEGIYPEFVPADAAYGVDPTIYLVRQENAAQGFMYQAGHEAFHRVRTPVVAQGHWADEMLAVQFSLRYLRERGEGSYAVACENDLSARALPVSELKGRVVRLDTSALGTCCRLGRAIRTEIGWEGLLALARGYSDRGPEPARWLEGLQEPRRTAVQNLVAPVIA